MWYRLEDGYQLIKFGCTGESESRSKRGIIYSIRARDGPSHTATRQTSSKVLEVCQITTPYQEPISPPDGRVPSSLMVTTVAAPCKFLQIWLTG